MATPPEACFHLLFQQHLERNAGDYIPPASSPAVRPLQAAWRECAAAEGAVTVHAAPPNCWQTPPPPPLPLPLPMFVSVLLICYRFFSFCCNAAETSRFKGNRDKTHQINYGTNTGPVKTPDKQERVYLY